MAIAPDSYLSACLVVVHEALLRARYIARHHDENVGFNDDAAEIAALMDAVHNLPSLLAEWENCDVSRLRDDLAHYDHVFGAKSRLELLKVLEGELAR